MHYSHSDDSLAEAVVTGHLNLSDRQLTSVPFEVYTIANLVQLDLSSNCLFDIPPEIGELVILQELNLSFNRLKSLPPEISSLQFLQVLLLSYNQLSGLCAELGDLPYLRVLDASDNQIEVLPASLARAPCLSSLHLRYNKLHSLPAAFCRSDNRQQTCLLARLAELSLDGNPLHPPRFITAVTEAVANVSIGAGAVAVNAIWGGILAEFSEAFLTSPPGDSECEPKRKTGILQQSPILNIDDMPPSSRTHSSGDSPTRPQSLVPQSTSPSPSSSLSTSVSACQLSPNRPVAPGNRPVAAPPSSVAVSNNYSNSGGDEVLLQRDFTRLGPGGESVAGPVGLPPRRPSSTAGSASLRLVVGGSPLPPSLARRDTGLPPPPRYVSDDDDVDDDSGRNDRRDLKVDGAAPSSSSLSLSCLRRLSSGSAAAVSGAADVAFDLTGEVAALTLKENKMRSTTDSGAVLSRREPRVASSSRIGSPGRRDRGLGSGSNGCMDILVLDDADARKGDGHCSSRRSSRINMDDGDIGNKEGYEDGDGICITGCTPALEHSSSPPGRGGASRGTSAAAKPVSDSMARLQSHFSEDFQNLPIGAASVLLQSMNVCVSGISEISSGRPLSRCGSGGGGGGPSSAAAALAAIGAGARPGTGGRPGSAYSRRPGTSLGSASNSLVRATLSSSSGNRSGVGSGRPASSGSSGRPSTASSYSGWGAAAARPSTALSHSFASASPRQSMQEILGHGQPGGGGNGASSFWSFGGKKNKGDKPENGSSVDPGSSSYVDQRAEQDRGFSAGSAQTPSQYGRNRSFVSSGDRPPTSGFRAPVAGDFPSPSYHTVTGARVGVVDSGSGSGKVDDGSYASLSAVTFPLAAGVRSMLRRTAAAAASGAPPPEGSGNRTGRESDEGEGEGVTAAGASQRNDGGQGPSDAPRESDTDVVKELLRQRRPSLLSALNAAFLEDDTGTLGNEASEDEVEGMAVDVDEDD